MKVDHRDLQPLLLQHCGIQRKIGHIQISLIEAPAHFKCRFGGCELGAKPSHEVHDPLIGGRQIALPDQISIVINLLIQSFQIHPPVL